jgi:hypothetical protein
LEGQYILRHRTGRPVFIQYRSHIFSDGCMAAVWEPIESWKQLYQNALLDFDPPKLKEQLELAQTAIQERIGELTGQSDRNTEERQELEDALSGLRVLRRDVA